MDPAERLSGDKSLQSLVTEGELAEREVALAAQMPLAQPDKIVGCIIFRSVDDAQIFAAAYLERRLDEALLATADEVARFDHHALAT